MHVPAFRGAHESAGIIEEEPFKNKGKDANKPSARRQKHFFFCIRITNTGFRLLQQHRPVSLSHTRCLPSPELYYPETGAKVGQTDLPVRNNQPRRLLSSSFCLNRGKLQLLLLERLEQTRFAERHFIPLLPFPAKTSVVEQNAVL